MTDKQAQSLREYYAKKYGTPKNDEEALEILNDVYKELIQSNFTLEEKEGISEYYRIISGRNLPAFEWLLEAFHVVSKKNSDKRNFGYIVGMIRTWLKYGFGHIPNSEEAEVIDYFEEISGVPITLEARLIIENLMGRFGAIAVTRMIGSLKDNADISVLMAKLLKELIEVRYDDKLDEPVDLNDSKYIV